MIPTVIQKYVLKAAVIGGLLTVSIFTINISTAQASIFDFVDTSYCDYGCGSYDPCDYGCGYSQPSYYSNPCDYGCGYSEPMYVNPCSYGCGAPQQPVYQYTPYPYMMYQQVYQPPVQNGGYNYVQYPYPMYHYFVNPSPKASNDVWSTPIRGY